MAAGHRLDETRRVRLAGEWATQFRVVFDYSLTADTVVATIHPNGTLDEFDLPQGRRGFPVTPRDIAGQHRRIDALISAAVARGATLVVLPELPVTETLAQELSPAATTMRNPRQKAPPGLGCAATLQWPGYAVPTTHWCTTSTPPPTGRSWRT